jgi:RES domain-containing protein
LITAWRICAKSKASAAFEGHGAAEYPGRWNPAGLRAVYAAENRSLAALEVLVHADKEFLSASSWSIIPVHFDPRLVSIPPRLPSDWKDVPAPESTRALGGPWLRKLKSAVLRVPSVVTLGEHCYVLNPMHPDFAKIEIGKAEAFTFDFRAI